MFGIPRKVGIVLGLVAIVEFLVLYGLAMSMDDEYSFGKNYLSDLGVGPGALAFNSGLVVTGALLSCFSLLGLYEMFGKDASGRFASILLAVDGLLLVCVGVFPEDVDPYHFIFSVAFFMTFLAVTIAMTVAFHRTNVLGRMGALVSGIASVFGIILLVMRGDPLSETMAVMAIIVWGALIAGAALAREYGKAIP